MKVKELTRPAPDGGRGAPKVYGIETTHLPKQGKQKLTPKFLSKQKKFISQFENEIVVHTVHGDIVFKIDHACVNNAPTRYCLTCNELLPDQRADPFAEQSRAHVTEHGESAVKSERWPPGYRVVNSFECTIEDRRRG